MKKMLTFLIILSFLPTALSARPRPPHRQAPPRPQPPPHHRVFEHRGPAHHHSHSMHTSDWIALGIRSSSCRNCRCRDHGI